MRATGNPMTHAQVYLQSDEAQANIDVPQFLHFVLANYHAKIVFCLEKPINIIQRFDAKLMDESKLTNKILLNIRIKISLI